MPAEKRTQDQSVLPAAPMLIARSETPQIRARRCYWNPGWVCAVKCRHAQ